MNDLTNLKLGLGIGWRPELALEIERHAGLGFVEVLAEDCDAEGELPPALVAWRRSGRPVVPHGVSLSLGGAERPDARRLARLARLAERFDAPLVSEHLAFVRAGGLESGHLLPLPRTRASLGVLVENIRLAQAELPVPLALENIASLIEWPEAELTEGEFLTEIVEQTGAWLLLDVENLYANARNHGGDPAAIFDKIPLERVAYIHVAGGIDREGIYHDTHCHPIPAGVLDLVADLYARRPPCGAMLEWDDDFPLPANLHAQLDAIAAATHRGEEKHGSLVRGA